MARRIVILQGHPSRDLDHLCHALADAYAAGAIAAGHEVRRVEIGSLDFPVLRSAAEWKSGPAPESLLPALDAINWANHLVIVFPLWTGSVPALLKAFFEQVARPGHAFALSAKGAMVPAWTGKSARLIVTMGMPAFAFRWFFGAHGVRFLRRGLLGMCGIKPVRTTYIGLVDAKRFKGERWIVAARELGGAGR